MKLIKDRNTAEHIRLLEKPQDWTHRVRAYCMRHKVEFTSSGYGNLTLHKVGCKQCHRENSRNGQAKNSQMAMDRHKEEQKERWEILEYVKPATYRCRCKVCGWEGNKHTQAFHSCNNCRLLSLKNARLEKQSAKEIQIAKNKELRIQQKIEGLENEIKQNPFKSGSVYRHEDHYKVACVCPSCEHRWDARVDNLKAGTGCPRCSTKWKKTKSIRLEGRSFRVQGNEDLALQWINKKRGLKGVTTKPSRIPVILYTHKGAKHCHFPDIKVGKTIFEVKSTFTLGLDGWPYGDGISPLARNKSKAKQAIQQGFNYRVLVAERHTGKCVVLPKDWYTMNKGEIREHLTLKGLFDK